MTKTGGRVQSLFKTRHAAHVHFVGLGGIGMSGIAEVLINLGYRVSGSDLKESDITRRLARMGATFYEGHKAQNLVHADVVVISSAVKKDNPEVVAARQRKIPVIPRAEMLAELMRLKYAVAVAGSHGKTTTTSMVATVLSAAGLDPTAVVGGKVNVLDSNAKLGKSELMVVEADESDGSFLKLHPSIAVVTNIDPEHMDHYGTLDVLQTAFVEFCNRVPFYGLNVLCLDHPNVQALLPRLEKRAVTYGSSHMADYRLEGVTLEGFTTRFQAFRRDEPLGEFRVRMVGAHNALNALAVIAVAEEMEIPLDMVRGALAEFGGVQRRFTVRGEVGGVTVVDDYGHHPTEVMATLAGARKAFGRRLVVAFQPHRYTRTHDLLKEFATSFNDSDVLFVTSVYGAGEEPIPGATGDVLAEAIRDHGHRDVTFVEKRMDLPAALAQRVMEGDLVLTLGAGDITQVGPELLTLLGKPSAPKGA
ncbi:UDP-N-acetylmuramate--L-alanine ligase [Stigmatella aurantiaca]|uniref:UDP-N-acetylmuramate--L-alanine ligase n=1 Tax=Stigmatella aurantiaca (strain DW4/3-1) TaxID=378806 RepID=Q09BM4_STIAD|nr:UDP-N-acetylmuramate--L-alanine ligase [Stigmatella aurantiaca]ADO74018.1 UDP-N-acetylmuramate--L-alanine ligase [Stigmatella aurantiaca DW4/3-1]EAU69213.1 UDP-N-acetylmuramate--alanine ligase [Stigmatella aurantiaca DW4/3-1]